MTPQTYIDVAKNIKSSGMYSTDGCSFIGWLMNDKYEPACWAHDYARMGLIAFDDGQSDNDNMFRNALRHLGMSKWKSNVIYWFTRTQGFLSEKLNMSASALIGFIFFVSVVLFMFYKSGGFS